LIEVAPKPKVKPKPKNKPKPKPPVEKTEDVKDEASDFNSLLKSLTPVDPEEQTPPREEVPDSTGQTSQIADFSKVMTRSELENLNSGVQPCWNVNAGGKNAESLVVTLRVYVNRDRTVRRVDIVDRIRDTHHQAAADAARRALLNPNCSTLRLPPEKYDRWKEFTYIFDPSQML